ncbi:hypothetical protein [uncultured Mediterranean phage uvDeep-CGR0-AD1-C123]|nr:hypothetical protein [uncultured Mediterranean phage uvDeep-CGR0-AD1-C123]
MPYYTNLLGMGAPVPNTYSPFRMSTAQPRGLFGPVGAGPPIRRATLPGPWTPPAFAVSPVTPPPDDNLFYPSDDGGDDGYSDNEPPYGSSDGTSGSSDDSIGFSSTAGGSYDGGYGGGYGGGHIGSYSGGTDYSFSDHEAVDGTGGGTNDQRASDYAAAVDAMNKAAQKSRDWTAGGLFSDPMGTLNKIGADPVNIPSIFMSMAGVPFGGAMLNAIGNYNLKTQAYDRAMTAMGTPGYSYGTIDGEPYSIGVNALGHRAMTGVTPDWFTVDMADRMSTVSEGYDPETGDSLTGFSPGVGGYNTQGDFVDQYGNAHAYGDWSDLESLADERGLTTSQVSQALDTARNTAIGLEAALDIVDDAKNYGFGDDYGTATNPDVASVEGVAGVTMDSDEFKHDPNGDDDDDDPNTDFSDEMDEEESPW